MEDGTARRFDVGDGYLVLQKWGSELFVLYIKMVGMDYRAMLHALKSLARHEGCTRIAGIGRRGWDRKLAKYGFVPDGDGGLQLDIKEA